MSSFHWGRWTSLLFAVFVRIVFRFFGVSAFPNGASALLKLERPLRWDSPAGMAGQQLRVSPVNGSPGPLHCSLRSVRECVWRASSSCVSPGRVSASSFLQWSGSRESATEVRIQRFGEGRICGLDGIFQRRAALFILQRLQLLSALPAVEFISCRALSRSAEHEARDACSLRGGQRRCVYRVDLLCNSR